MGLFEQLFPDRKENIVGFTGGEGKNYLLEQLANHLTTERKRVLIAPVGNPVLPVTGEIVVNQDVRELVDTIQQQFNHHPVLFVGQAFKEHMVNGFNSTQIRHLIKHAPYDYFFIMVGPPEFFGIFSSKTIQQLQKYTFLHRLLYCFPISILNREINTQDVEDVSEFRNHFQVGEDKKILDHELIIKYLKDTQQGLGSLLKGDIPVSLLLTGVENVLDENRVIMLARSLLNQGIHPVYMANLKQNLVKPAISEM